MGKSLYQHPIESKILDEQKYVRFSAKIILCFAGIILFCAAFRDFWYPDEPDMAEITRQMMLTGDWLRLHLYGKTFADYPPLFFWATTLFAKIGGLHELPMRLPTALSSIGLLSLTWLWAKKNFGERHALWTVLILCTTQYFFWQSINMHVDMMLSFFIGAAIISYDFSFAEENRRRKVSLLALSGLCMGLGTLVKGPIGVVLPAGVLFWVHVARREWRGLLSLALACAGGTAIFVWWSVAYAGNTGGGNLYYFIFRQNIARFTQGVSHARPPYYYFTNIWMTMFPWSFILLGAVPYAIKKMKKKSRNYTLALVWFAVIFIFFCISKSKRNVYLLPLYPAAANMIAAYITRMEDKRVNIPSRINLWIITAIVAIAGISAIPVSVVAAIKMPSLPSRLFIPVTIFSAVLVTSSLFLLKNMRAGNFHAAYRIIPAAFLAIYLVIYGWIYPTVDKPFSAKEDAQFLRTLIDAKNGEKIAWFAPKPPKESTVLEFYGKVEIEYVENQEEVTQYLSHQPNGIIIIEEKKLDEFNSTISIPFETLKKIQIGNDTFFLMKPNHTSLYPPSGTDSLVLPFATIRELHPI